MKVMLIIFAIILSACGTFSINSTPIHAPAVPIPTVTSVPVPTILEKSDNIGISAWERYPFIPDNYFDQEMSAQIYYNLTDSYIAGAEVELCFGGVCKTGITDENGKVTVKLKAPEAGWKYEYDNRVPWKVCVLNSTPRVCMDSYSIITWEDVK